MFPFWPPGLPERWDRRSLSCCIKSFRDTWWTQCVTLTRSAAKPEPSGFRIGPSDAGVVEPSGAIAKPSGSRVGTKSVARVELSGARVDPSGARIETSGDRVEISGARVRMSLSRPTC